MGEIGTVEKKETIIEGKPDLGPLEGLGMDTKELEKTIGDAAGVEAKEKPAEKAKPEELKTGEAKIGDDFLIDEKLVKDGEYKLEDGTKVTVKDSKIETMHEKEELKEGETKVGDEVLIDEKPVKDGEYKLKDGIKVTVKDSKIEVIHPKEKVEKKKEFEEDIENPFITKEKEEVEKIEKVDLKDFEGAAEFLSKGIGVEIKNLNDLNKVVDEFSTVKKQLTDANSEKSDLLVYKDIFEKMPDDLYAISQAWLNDEDYHVLLNKLASESLDFTKSFEEHNLNELIESYSNEKFSEEDYQAISDKDHESHKHMQSVVNLTKKAYDKDKDAFRSARKTYENGISEQRKSLKVSINSAVDHFTKSVPDLKEKHKSEIIKVLEAGHNGIYNMFFDKNDAFKPEAGEFIALALYGKAAIEYQSKIAAKKAATKAESKANEEIVTRSADKAKPSKGVAGGSGDEIVTKFKEHVLPTKTVENPFLISM